MSAAPIDRAAKAADAWRALAARSEVARAALHEAIREAAAAGATEAEITRRTGLARMTVRNALGKG